MVFISDMVIMIFIKGRTRYREKWMKHLSPERKRKDEKTVVGGRFEHHVNWSSGKSSNKRIIKTKKNYIVNTNCIEVKNFTKKKNLGFFSSLDDILFNVEQGPIFSYSWVLMVGKATTINTQGCTIQEKNLWRIKDQRQWCYPSES